MGSGCCAACALSVNLSGMDIRTMERDRRDSSEEFLAGQIKRNMRSAAEFVNKHGMTDVPMAVTEDATSALARLDGILKTNEVTGKQEVWVDGFDEPIMIDNDGGDWGDRLQKEFDVRKEDNLARYVYVWTLVPQLPEAPYLPIFMVATNNRFDARWVWQWWEFIMQEAKEICFFSRKEV